VPIVVKSGSLNLLKPYGPVQAYNGIALPLPLLLINFFIFRSLGCLNEQNPPLNVGAPDLGTVCPDHILVYGPVYRYNLSDICKMITVFTHT
jgi:hypothetical protein